MAGYGAVISLQQTIERILESSRWSLDSSSRKVLRIINIWKLGPLQKILERLDRTSKSKSRKKVNDLDVRIKDAVWRFEDLLEYHLSEHHERDAFLISIDLEKDKYLQRKLDSFIEFLNELEEEYICELENMRELVDEVEFDGMKKANMVGFSHLFQEMKHYLTIGEEYGNINFSLVGMSGSGKTTLATKFFFEDPDVSGWFQHRAWVTIGRRYDFNEIAHRILAQLNLDHINEERLECKRRCLIVLDDVWDDKVFHFLKSYLLDMDNTLMVRILVTTHLEEVARYMSRLVSFGYYIIRPMLPLNDEESKDLLRKTMFREEEYFPSQLEKAAEKILMNCKGLPIMIVTVADLLSKANKNDNPEFWNKVAENPNPVAMLEAHNQLTKVLFPVYDCFTQSSKMLYLYMGAFPQDYDIPASKLRNLLAGEGLFQEDIFHEIMGEDKFDCGVISNVVMSPPSFKTCRLNSSWRYLLNNEASDNKFLSFLNSGVVDRLEQCIYRQRRFCLHANFLFKFRNVYEAVKGYDSAYTARSLLCLGPYHPYSVPLDVGFKLLRVLDALKVRFYEFPVEIMNLVLLQYLALTYNGELPTYISQFVSLQFLIIHPHLSIKRDSSSSSSSNVPVQIWDMQELKHIEIMGSNVPKPNSPASLQKLSTLLGVSADSCTNEVLTKLPNITKLGIRIELTPESGISTTTPLCLFNEFPKLEKLETLKCVVVNPELEFGCVSFMKALCMIKSNLRKLHLSGLGCLWGDMEVIGSMPNLEKLKLQCYAFRGSKWEIKCGGFLSLEYLVIEDTDLVQWEPGRGCFSKLRRLSMKHCYKLQELCWPYDAKSGRIEMVECNPLAVTCARKLKPRDENCSIQVIASFDEDEDEELE